MKQGILFGNRRIHKPGVYGRMDAKGSVARDYTDQKTIIILGTAKGGEPEKLKWYDNPNRALADLRGGDLYDAVNLLYNTSTSGLGEGAGTIGIIRTQPSKQATVDLGVWGKATAKDYGVHTNSINIAVTDGSIEGAKTVTINHKDDNRYEYFRNVGAIGRVLSEETGVKVIVSVSGGEKTIEVKDDSKSYGSISAKDPRIQSLRRLAEYIGSISEGKIKLELVEEISAKTTTIDLDAKEVEPGKYLTALKSEMIGRLEESQYLSIEIHDNQTIDNISTTSLQMGADGLSPASWKKYYDIASSAHCSIIVPLSDSQIHIAEALAHANLMSNEKAKERIVVAGMGDSVTEKSAINLAQTLGNTRIQLIPQSAYVRIEGTVRRVPGYLVACLQAGRCSFISNGESTTYSYFPIVKLGQDFDEEAIVNMLKAGCTLFETTQQGTRCIQDITTYTDSEESLYTERSVIMLSDTINKELRAKLEDLQVGKKGLASTPETVKNATISFLKDKIAKEEIVAYRNISVTFYNRVVTIDYEVAPVEPVNFILITGHFYTNNEITA